MNMHIFSETEGDILLSAKNPVFLWDYKIPGSKDLAASGNFGDILLQQTCGDTYTIWYNNFQFRKSQKITMGTGKPAWILRFILTNTFYYSNNSANNPMYEYTFNFIYSPEQEKIAFRDKLYGNLEIYFSPDYLATFANDFQHLAQWLQTACNTKHSSLCKINQVADANMMKCIRELLNPSWVGNLRAINYNALVTELLLLVLKATVQQQRHKTIRFAAREVETFYELKTFLITHLDQPVDIDFISGKFNVTPRTLKRRFYTLFGVKLYNFLLDIRMEQAGRLLMETETSIESVAELTGYRSFANFSTAFKKYYGRPPKYFRSK